MKKYIPLCAVIVSMFIWGTVGVFRKSIDATSSVVSLFRGVVGCVTLLGFHLCRKNKQDTAALKKHFGMLLFTGGVIGMNWVCFFEAQRYTAVSTATLCYYMAPTIIVLLSPICFGERLTVKKLLCALCALGGMVLLSGILGENGVATNDFAGMLFGLAAAAMYAFIVIFNKKMSEVDAVSRTTVQLGASAVVLIPYILLTNGFAGCVFTADSLWRLLFIGVVHTGLAYAMYFYAVVKLPAQTSALLSYIDPVTAVVLSGLVLHEKMHIAGYIGAVMILGSAIVAEWTPSKKERNI